MASLESLIAGRNLSKLVEGVKSGLPRRMPEAFFQRTDEFSGHTAEWYETDGNRDVATIVSQDSPAQRIGHQNLKSRSATMLRSFESQRFNANKLRNLIDPTTPDARRDEMGKAFVTRNAEWFKKRQENLIQSAIQMMALKFALYFDAAGNLLPSSSGATVSVDPAIPAGQLTTLDILGSGAILGTSWATDSTDIMGNLFDIRDQMRQLGGWEMKYAFHGKNVPKFIGANAVAKEYINQTPALATQRYTGNQIVPNGFCDYIWVNVGDAFFIDSGGTVRKMIDDDDIVFTPEPSAEWWKNMVGSEMVPNGTLNIGQTVEEVLGDLTEVYGSFAYAAREHNPVSIDLFSGINFLPVIAATKAVCRGHTTP